MAIEMPYGRTLDMDFMFTKLLVGNLEDSAAFYTSVFGVVEMHRVEAEIDGRNVSEIVYQPTYSGGPMFILAKFHDAARTSSDELILGFATKDLDAFLSRVEKAGGRILEKSPDNPPSGFRHAFIADLEGHVVQVSQALG